MIIPGVVFKSSWIYQTIIHSSPGFVYDSEKIKEVESFISKIEGLWRPIENKVLSFISEVSSISWESKSPINCYVVHTSHFLPLSDPLTIPMNFDSGKKIYGISPARFIDFFIHELIHNLFIQSSLKQLSSYFRWINHNCPYRGSNENVNVHISVHALLKKVFLKFFDEKRLKEEVEQASFYPDYKEAWGIVTKIGEDRVLNDILKNHDWGGFPTKKA